MINTAIISIISTNMCVNQVFRIAFILKQVLIENRSQNSESKLEPFYKPIFSSKNSWTNNLFVLIGSPSWSPVLSCQQGFFGSSNQVLFTKFNPRKNSLNFTLTQKIGFACGNDEKINFQVAGIPEQVGKSRLPDKSACHMFGRHPYPNFFIWVTHAWTVIRINYSIYCNINTLRVHMLFDTTCKWISPERTKRKF